VRRPAGLQLTVRIVEAHERILVGDVELVADQRDAVRRVQILGKGRPLIPAVAIAVAQQ
jgi:hypothetical protein